jgi:hypothetical protein
VLFIFAGASTRAQEPDEETKTRALKRAYQINGNSMVRWGSIDLSGGPLPSDDAICTQIDGEATGQQFFECRQPVKTVPIMPVTDPRQYNAIDAIADAIAPASQVRRVKDICTLHGMRKVITGDSWRCRK